MVTSLILSPPTPPPAPVAQSAGLETKEERKGVACQFKLGEVITNMDSEALLATIRGTEDIIFVPTRLSWVPPHKNTMKSRIDTPLTGPARTRHKTGLIKVGIMVTGVRQWKLIWYTVDVMIDE